MMNKSFIVVCTLVTLSLGAYAQTSPGNMMVGGGLNFSSRSYEGGSTSDYNSVSFAPSFGYFVSDNFAVGAVLELESARSGTGSGKTINTSFGLGPFARYYIFTSNEQFGFFGEAQLRFGTGKTDPPSGDVTRSNSVAFELSPGAVFFFNEHWALEFTIKAFSFSSVDPDTDSGDNKYTTVEIGLNSLQPGIGFRYHF